MTKSSRKKRKIAVSSSDNWKDILPEFTERLQGEWEKKGFNYEECKEWINNGLKPTDADYAWWLKTEIEINPSLYGSKNKEKKEKWEETWKKFLSIQNAQEWLEVNYPKKNETTTLFARNKNLGGKLIIKGYQELRNVYCEHNSNLTHVELIDLPELTHFSVSDCHLENIRIKGCQKISYLNVSNNYLRDLNFLDSLQPERIKYLGLHNNDIGKKENEPEEKQNLSIFSRFVNLEELYIDNSDKGKFEKDLYNRFTGSLKPLKDLEKLKWLNISGTDVGNDLGTSEKDIDYGLWYLPNSVKKIGCKSNNDWVDKEGKKKVWSCEKIQKKLKKKFGATKEPQQIEVDEPQFAREWCVVEPFFANKTDVMIAPSLLLKSLNKNRIKENYDCDNINYREIRLRDGKPFSWEITNNNFEQTTIKKLPSKLYNIKTKKVEKTKRNLHIKNYATLSYAYGSTDPNDKKLSAGGRKALTKARETCFHLGIDYLWMDQLCINQDNKEEKAQEIKKMHQYFSNADVTLIAINTKAEEKNSSEEPTTFSLLSVLELILRSKWFTRCWTFQEGWLSKQTIFMFDDFLIDGRIMAGVWVLEQPSYSDGIKYNNINEFNDGSKKIATPIGWTYYKKGYNHEDTIFLTLNEILRAVKKRKRTLPIDSIYSILGLLPYGNKVRVDYSLTPQQALFEVMKTAVENGYAEPLAWHGIGKNVKGIGRCLLPNIDKKGSTSVQGSLYIQCKQEERETRKAITFMPNCVKIADSSGLTYTIKQFERNTVSFDVREDFLIDGGAYMKDIVVTFIDKKEYKEKRVTLLGTREALEEMKPGDHLVTFGRGCWKSNKPFGIVIRREGNRYHRIGLVEFQKGTEKELKQIPKDEELTIWINDYNQKDSCEQLVFSEEDSINDCQEFVEQPPKERLSRS